MSFDQKAFMREKFRPRQKVVAVPELQSWFGEDAAAEWTVGSLSGAQLSRVRTAAEREQAIMDLAETIASVTGKEKSAALKQLMDLDDTTLPEDHIKRIEMLILGSIDPICDRELAKRIAAVYPVVFMRLTDAVLQQTGLGYEPGKPKDSGETPASATP